MAQNYEISYYETYNELQSVRKELALMITRWTKCRREYAKIKKELDTATKRIRDFEYQYQP